MTNRVLRSLRAGSSLQIRRAQASPRQPRVVTSADGVTMPGQSVPDSRRAGARPSSNSPARCGALHPVPRTGHPACSTDSAHGHKAVTLLGFGALEVLC
jgi:hypothetical protein